VGQVVNLQRIGNPLRVGSETVQAIADPPQTASLPTLDTKMLLSGLVTICSRSLRGEAHINPSLHFLPVLHAKPSHHSYICLQQRNKIQPKTRRGVQAR